MTAQLFPRVLARTHMGSELLEAVGDEEAALVLEDVLKKSYGQRTKIEKRFVYRNALKLYLNGWQGHAKPTISEVADKLGLPIKALEATSINRDWPALRANKDITEERAVEAHRAAIVLRVDKAVVEHAEMVIAKASDHYIRLLDTVGGLGEDAAPRETSTGHSVKSQLEDKVFLMVRLTQGFMALAQGAKALGMVRTRMPGDEDRGVLDPAKLAGLSLTVINMGKDGTARIEERPAIDVLELGPDDKKGSAD